MIEFEPCENDTICTVSCEHNAAFSLEHEVTKWMTCFSKETRNLIRIDQQLIKCYDLIEAGKKVRSGVILMPIHGSKINSFSRSVSADGRSERSGQCRH